MSMGLSMSKTAHTSNRAVNKLILVGHLGRDPEIVEKRDGSRYAVTSLATRRYDDHGNECDRTDWHRLVFPHKMVPFVEKLRIGDRIYVEGRLEYDAYERDGITVPQADVQVREVVLLRGSPGKAAPPPEREYDVTFAVELELRRTVLATSEEEARKIGKDAAARMATDMEGDFRGQMPLHGWDIEEVYVAPQRVVAEEAS